MNALLSNPHKHYYTTRQKPVSLIVLHVTAGLEDLDMQGEDHSAAATNRYGATTSRAASWHSCVDSDSIEPALPDEYTAFHVRNYNSPSLGLEISNRDARWDNKPLEWIQRTLRNAAVVCLAWEKKFGIPRRLLTKAQVDAGLKGYTYHMFLDPTRRSDPGKTFPWDRFVQILDGLESGIVPLPSTPVPTPPKPPTQSPPPFPLPAGWYFGPKSGPRHSVSGYYSHREDLRRWQNKMKARGWRLDADGLYGPQTAEVAEKFQREKGLGVDGLIGVNTWRAAWTTPVT